MKRFLHILGSVLGIGLVAIPAVTDAVPEGKAKAALQVTGAAFALAANVYKALGRAPATP